MTDLAGWRLRVDEGRQVWEYLEADAERKKDVQSTGEKYWLGTLQVRRIQ